MKLKTVLVTAVIVLLVVAIALMAERSLVSQVERDTEKRIRQYRMIEEEQRLITSIVTLRYEAALIQAKFNPAPIPQEAPPK